MTEATQVSIGQVKKEIDSLVDRVADTHETIIVTSHGKPKAALISMEDYAYLQQATGKNLVQWEGWWEEQKKLTKEILAGREQDSIPVDEMWEAARAELESRDADRNRD
jgi:prevent-host-death family protein